MASLRPLASGVKAWLDRLSTGWAVVLLAGVTVAAVTGGVFTYRMYDYVQHDNDFCLSCHLMVDPYELFAESAHRGMGCKACHQPTLIQRSTMGLTQILENPDSLSAHAHVPNQRCVTCHVEGDPEEWLQVANSAGHRIHFESREPVLDGLQCVQCHSSSLHQFTASDETCGQSECHTDTRIQLGKMAGLTIHCAACHGFSAVVPAVETGSPAAAEGLTPRRAIAPDAETCLSCHAMRAIMDLPEEDPHEGLCASCHNPHTQTTPAEAVQSCGTAGCHEDPMSGTPLHSGLAPGVMENCLGCHQAHGFQAQGNQCLDCHADIFETDAAPAGIAVLPRSSGVVHASLGPAIANAALESRSLSASPASSLETSLVHPPTGQVARDSVRFRHQPHRNVDCTSCHSADTGHGSLLITGISDCRSCHHADPSPSPGGCNACHADEAHPPQPYPVERTLTMSVTEPVTRSLPFDHEDHTGESCGTCHVDGLTLSAAAVDCSSCHQEHHEIGNQCRSCHVPAPAPAHSVQVHLGCATAGCHQNLPFGGGVPRQREFCMTCHQDKVDHRPDEPDCSQCHQLPPPGPNAEVRGGVDG